MRQLPERILSKVQVVDGCWLWTGALSTAGYGRICWEGRILQAHRVVRHLLVGDVDPRTTDHRTDQMDHLCRNRRCVNPEHVEPVTARENVLRGTSLQAMNARKTRCPAGHEYDMDDGGRRCRSCRRRVVREANRRYRAKAR